MPGWGFHGFDAPPEARPWFQYQSLHMKDEHVEQQAAQIEALQQQIRDLQRAATVRSVKKF